MEVLSAALPAHSLVSAFPNTKRGDTKVGFGEAAFCSQCIATTPTGLSELEIFFIKRVPKTWRLLSTMP